MARKTEKINQKKGFGDRRILMNFRTAIFSLSFLYFLNNFVPPVAFLNIKDDNYCDARISQSLEIMTYSNLLDSLKNEASFLKLANSCYVSI